MACILPGLAAQTKRPVRLNGAACPGIVRWGKELIALVQLTEPNPYVVGSNHIP
jgi:hypothetical protein